MAEANNRFKLSLQPIRFCLCLGIVIQSALILGMTLAYSIRTVETSIPSSLSETEQTANSFSLWLPNGNEADLADKIRTARRISLLESTAFDRISKIHYILGGFHSGLPVEDEERLAALIYQESLRYGYDPELIVSVILTESSFYKWAHSRKGAIGLMQLLPMTGQALAESNQIPLQSMDALYDPNLNIKLGTQYLASLHERFGDLGLALAAYNHGPTRVASLIDRGKQWPTGYTQKVLQRYKQLLHEKPMDVLPPATHSNL